MLSTILRGIFDTTSWNDLSPASGDDANASTSDRVTLSDKDERISDKDLNVQLQLLSSGRVGMENPGESFAHFLSAMDKLTGEDPAVVPESSTFYLFSFASDSALYRPKRDAMKDFWTC